MEVVIDDDQFNRNKALQVHDNKILENLEKRDSEYHNILVSYRKYTEEILKANPTRQQDFFCVSLGILIVSFIVFSYVLCTAVNSESSNIVSILAAATELLVAFLIFPKIIAEYLFNTNENANIKDIVAAIRQYDIKLSEDVRNMLKNERDSE